MSKTPRRVKAASHFLYMRCALQGLSISHGTIVKTHDWGCLVGRKVIDMADVVVRGR